LTNKKIIDNIFLIVPKKQKDKKVHRFFRLTRIQAYLLIKSIKRQLREQEKKAKIRA
jgi:hypothetical protein